MSVRLPDRLERRFCAGEGDRLLDCVLWAAASTFSFALRAAKEASIKVAMSAKPSSSSSSSKVGSVDKRAEASGETGGRAPSTASRAARRKAISRAENACTLSPGFRFESSAEMTGAGEGAATGSCLLFLAGEGRTFNTSAEDASAVLLDCRRRLLLLGLSMCSTSASSSSMSMLLGARALSTITNDDEDRKGDCFRPR